MSWKAGSIALEEFFYRQLVIVISSGLLENLGAVVVLVGKLVSVCNAGLLFYRGRMRAAYSTEARFVIEVLTILICEISFLSLSLFDRSISRIYTGRCKDR